MLHNYLFLLFQLHRRYKPTRVTYCSASDHIYTNSYLSHEFLAGIIKTDLSDHFPVFIIDNNLANTNFPDKVTKKIKIINNVTINKFKQNLLEMDWSLVTNTQDASMAHEVFKKQFLNIYNKCFR